MTETTNLNVEEKIKQDLIGKFKFLENKVIVQRKRRIFADAPAERIFDLFDHAINSSSFPMLIAIIGLDEGQSFGVIYSLSREDGIVLNLKINIPRNNPVLSTVTTIFPNAEIFERELVDLFGIKVEGIKEGMRYPLSDDWPADQYPLRKDWTADMLPKRGAK